MGFESSGKLIGYLQGELCEYKKVKTENGNFYLLVNHNDRWSVFKLKQSSFDSNIDKLMKEAERFSVPYVFEDDKIKFNENWAISQVA